MGLFFTCTQPWHRGNRAGKDMLFEQQISELREMAEYLTDVRTRAAVSSAAIKAEAFLAEVDALADESDKKAFGWKASRRKSARCVDKIERRLSRRPNNK